MPSKKLLKFLLLSIFLHVALAAHVLSVGVLDAVHESVMVDVINGKNPQSKKKTADRKTEQAQPAASPSLSPSLSPTSAPAETAASSTSGTDGNTASADGTLVTEGLRPLNLTEINKSIKRTQAAIEKNIEGQIKLKLLVDATGVVKRVTAMNELGFGLDQVASEAAWKLRFVPAKIKSQSVPLETYYTVKFTIKHQ